MRSMCLSFLSNGKKGELLAIPASTYHLFSSLQIKETSSAGDDGKIIFH